MQSPPSAYAFDGKMIQLQRNDSEEEKKRPKNKRSQKTAEKTASRYKKRRKDEEERHAIYSNTDVLMNQLKQVGISCYLFQICLLTTYVHRKENLSPVVTTNMVKGSGY